MGRLDQQEAVYEFFGGFSTSLYAAAPAGATTLQSNASVPEGFLQVDTGSAAEIVLVTSVTGAAAPYSLTLEQPTQQAHAAGAILGTFHTSPSSVFPWLKTVCKGEPVEMLEFQMPVLYILTPQSREYRQAAQKKFIDYTIRCVLVDILSGQAPGDVGPVAVTTFYGYLDAIAQKIRTGSAAKALITPSYPQGASIRFGEDSTIQTDQQRQENDVVLIAQIDILSTEQVNA